jgi:hypothetical protein
VIGVFHWCQIAEAAVRPDRIVQRGAVTPTGPRSRKSAKFSIAGIPGPGGCQIHEAVEKVSGTVLRCSLGGAGERWLELPAWMFDRAACMAMRVTADLVVEFAALAALQELLAAAMRQDDVALSSNTPVLSPLAHRIRDRLILGCRKYRKHLIWRRIWLLKPTLCWDRGAPRPP